MSLESAEMAVETDRESGVDGRERWGRGGSGGPRGWVQMERRGSGKEP